MADDLVFCFRPTLFHCNTIGGLIKLMNLEKIQLAVSGVFHRNNGQVRELLNLQARDVISH